MKIYVYTIGGFVTGALTGGAISGYKTRVNRQIADLERYLMLSKELLVEADEEVKRLISDSYSGELDEKYKPLPKMPPITVTTLEDLGVVMSDIEQTIIETFEAQDDAYSEEVEDEQFVLVDAAPAFTNVFGAEEDEWDWEAETAQRGEDAPYVIHIDEFRTDEMNYHQHTLTYYEGDDILADEKDVPIYNYSDLVGDLKFGHGSEDRNIVYVRNDKYGAEYEVILHRGSYEVEVRGMQIEQEFASNDLKHSAYRFRHDD